MSKINLKELREKAEKATPGPWACEDMFEVITAVEQDLDVAFPPICLTDLRGNTELGDSSKDANANFIASANPEAVKALITALETAVKTLDIAVNYFESIGYYKPKESYIYPELEPPEPEECIAKDFKEALAFVNERVKL